MGAQLFEDVTVPILWGVARSCRIATGDWQSST